MSAVDTGVCVVRYARWTDPTTGLTTYIPAEPPELAGMLAEVSRPATPDEIAWATPAQPEPAPEP